jgi:hypothetical protein
MFPWRNIDFVERNAYTRMENPAMKRLAWTGGLLLCGLANFARADDYNQPAGGHANAGQMSALPGSYAAPGGGCAACGQAGAYGGCAPWNPTCCRISKREAVMPNLWGDYCATQTVYDRCAQGCGGLFGSGQDWSQGWEAGWHGSCCQGRSSCDCGAGAGPVSDSCGSACAPPAPCRARLTWNWSWCRNLFGLGREDWGCESGCDDQADEYASDHAPGLGAMDDGNASTKAPDEPMPLELHVPQHDADEPPALTPTPAPDAEPMPLTPARDDSV